MEGLDISFKQEPELHHAAAPQNVRLDGAQLVNRLATLEFISPSYHETSDESGANEQCLHEEQVFAWK